MARRLQMEEESVPQNRTNTVHDEEFARRLQSAEDDKISHQGGSDKRVDLNDSPPPGDFEGFLRIRKELKGLGWRLVYVRICGSTLAVYSDERQTRAELRVELNDAALEESSSQGKLRSLKDEIFRWKIAISEYSASENLSVVDGGRRGKGEVEFAAAGDAERAAWLGWCMVAGATIPPSAELTAKAFRPLLSPPATPERAQALKALASALAIDSETHLKDGTLTRALASSGVLDLLAECLDSSPGQESAARCVYYAAHADQQVASALAKMSAATSLLPLLTAPDDNLQRWAAPAMAPILGDSYQAARGVIEGGGAFTIVALLSSSSCDVRSHALAAIVVLCATTIKAAWPKTGLGSEEAKNLMHNLVEAAVDAGVCRCLALLLKNQPHAHISTAALEVLVAMSMTSDCFLRALRREIGRDEELAAELVAHCSNQLFGRFMLRILADSCYCFDERTGLEEIGEAAVAAHVAKALFVAGGLNVALEALGSEAIAGLLPSSLLEASARAGAAARERDHFVDLRHDDGARIVAALIKHVHSDPEDLLFDTSRALSALVSTIAYELAPSLDLQDGKPKAAAALSALIDCISACAEKHDASPAVEVARAGLFELIFARNFLNSEVVKTFDTNPSRTFVAARAATLVHVSIVACWRESSDDSKLILTIMAPPHGRALSRLCDLLDNLVSSELLLSEANVPDPPLAEALTIAIFLALGSLCGAARSLGHEAHPSEYQCKVDVAKSVCCGLAIAASLSQESSAVKHIGRRRAAARLLAALVCHDHVQPPDAHQTLARAGLVGVAARSLNDEDPLVRADSLSAFASLAAHGSGDDPDIIAGISVLGTALARGIVASDAAAKVGKVSSNVTQAQTTVAVEMALHALATACHRGGEAALAAVASSPGCLEMLVSLSRTPPSGTSNFGLRCADICLSVINALATACEDRAVALADAGVCDAIASILVEANRDKRNDEQPLEVAALTLCSTLSTHPTMRRQLITSPIFIPLFLKITNVQDAFTFKLARLAISTLCQFAHPASDAHMTNKLVVAAKRTRAVCSLTFVLNGGWRAHCEDDTASRAMAQAANQIITALANAPNSDSEIKRFDGNALTRKREQTTLTPEFVQITDGGMRRALRTSVSVLHADFRHGFELRYSTWLRTGSTSSTKLTPSAATGLDMDMTAIISLITAPMPTHSSEGTTAHILAIDRASLILESLMAEDVTGTTATEAIQGGVLIRLLSLGPTSPAIASCLVTLCRVGELHRPLLLSAPTPKIAVNFVDALINMLCAVQKGSSCQSDLEIIQASVRIIHAICSDSDTALLALAISFAASSQLSSAVARLASLSVSEAVARPIANISTSKDNALALSGTVVLLSLLSPCLHDALDDHERICLSSKHSMDSSLASDSELIPIQSLLDAFPTEAPRAQTIVRSVVTSGFASLLDAPALNAVARATPAILRIVSILPPGGFRARARHAVNSMLAQSVESCRHLQGAGVINAAAKLVIESKMSDGRTAAADTALGLKVLSSMVDETKDRAVRSSFAHDAFLPAIVRRVIQAAATSSIDCISLCALNLLVKLASAGEDAAEYLASRDDLLGVLVVQSTMVTRAAESSALGVNEPGGELARASTYAILILAHLAAGGLPQRNAIAGVHGIFFVAFSLLKDAEPGIVQTASAKLSAAILESHGLTDLTTSAAVAAVSALEAAISTIWVYESFDVWGHLVSIIDALFCHREGAIALQSAQPMTILVSLLIMTVECCPGLAEACAACIDSLSHDPYHMNCMSKHHMTTALLSTLTKEQTSPLLCSLCTSILDHISRTIVRSAVRRVPIDASAHGAISKLSNGNLTTARAARRLAVILGIDTTPANGTTAHDLPSSTAKASIAAALVAL
jgi:hypothetical protein